MLHRSEYFHKKTNLFLGINNTPQPQYLTQYNTKSIILLKYYYIAPLSTPNYSSRLLQRVAFITLLHTWRSLHWVKPLWPPCQPALLRCCQRHGNVSCLTVACWPYHSNHSVISRNGCSSRDFHSCIMRRPPQGNILQEKNRRNMMSMINKREMKENGRYLYNSQRRGRITMRRDTRQKVWELKSNFEIYLGYKIKTRTWCCAELNCYFPCSKNLSYFLPYDYFNCRFITLLYVKKNKFK